MGRAGRVVGVRGDEAAEAAGVFFTLTVFVLILGLFAFINMAGGDAKQKGEEWKDDAEWRAAAGQEGVYTGGTARTRVRE
jgi:hypothetical protein